MPDIEEPIETFALPEQPDIDPRIECGGDADEGMHGDAIGVPAFDAPDSGTRHAATRFASRPGSSLARWRSARNPETEPHDIHNAEGWN